VCGDLQGDLGLGDREARRHRPGYVLAGGCVERVGEPVIGGRRLVDVDVRTGGDAAGLLDVQRGLHRAVGQAYRASTAVHVHQRDPVRGNLQVQDVPPEEPGNVRVHAGQRDDADGLPGAVVSLVVQRVKAVVTGEGLGALLVVRGVFHVRARAFQRAHYVARGRGVVVQAEDAQHEPGE